MIRSKKILLGISGSIAAYKIPLLVRLLKKAGAQVQVVLTPDAASFVTPLTLSTLSEAPVHSEFVINDQGEWTNHVALAMWADLIVLAPATANTMAKMEQGICDNLLMAVYLSAKSKVMFAPAMDLDMYKHPSTQRNISSLLERGHLLVPAGTGFLASGLEGEGRMAEPETILEQIESYFSANQYLEGKKILISAGPTYEPIDPVRFIGNHSSGKMGLALAFEAVQAGALVHLVLGPTDHMIPELMQHPACKVTRVQTAVEMYDSCLKHWSESDIGIMAAAVADYRPVSVSQEKIKKQEETMTLTLVKNPDILKNLGAQKSNEQFLVGFALETTAEEFHAQQKLESKNADLILMNSLNDRGAGFGTDTNLVTLVSKHAAPEKWPLMSKTELARKILHYISARLNASN